MEYPFSSKEKGVGYWAAPGVQMDSAGQFDNGVRIPLPDDPFGNFADLMNVDAVGLYSSGSGPDQLFSSYMLLNCPPSPYGSFDALNFVDQGPPTFSDRFDASGSSYVFGDKSNLQPDDTQIAYQLDLSSGNDSQQNERGALVPRYLGPSLDEKMLKALSLFKESSGVGILAQVWVPIQQGDKIILSTCEQPFLLDKMLEGYREVSRRYSFSAEEKSGSFPGLPGRVFLSKVPEWTSNVVYYNHNEYLRVKHAADHNIRGSIALPIFDSNDMSCCAVLELVTMKEQLNFEAEVENVCTALQAVNLRTNPPRRHHKSLSRNQRAALAEIADVLRVVCHAHKFPLAMTWIPCICTEGDSDESIRVHVHEGKKDSDEKYVLCVENSACYVSDKKMEGFVHACAEHYLGEGQGMVGKALQSNHPFFFPDVKSFDISEYPLVHHARRFGLNAAVAIRLRSTYTGDDDYILEFFLPVNIQGSAEQQLLLDNLSRTMQRICKTLRTVSAAELGGEQVSKTRLLEASVPTHARKRISNAVLSDSSMNCTDSRLKADGLESYGLSEQVADGSRRQQEKKKSTTEKTVSLSVLQQYFSGSLKDAATNIGVCPTTLKRICRQHGISRWPSRKINKVNRSLRKIQTVLDSVQGVEGGLKFDPTTCGFVAAAGGFCFPDTQKPSAVPENISTFRTPDSLAQERKSGPYINDENYAIKLEKDVSMGEVKKPTAILESRRMKNNVSRHTISFALGDQLDTKHEGDYGAAVHNGPTCSSMTDSSNGSGSIMHGSSSTSQNFEEGKRALKPELNYVDSSMKITVKATYRDDMARFKFEPSYGCFQLYEEVAKRFRIQNGMFQLKYLDDEEEWVMLAGDSDLQECLEIMEYSGTRCVKFLVRDSPATMGSSGSSNCFLMGGS